MSALLESMSSGFDALPPALVEAQGLGAPRRSALAAVMADGLPGPRSEAWKYTSLRALSARRFGSANDLAAVDAAALAAIPAPRLVLVNGRFDAALSQLGGLPEGVHLQPLSQALAGDDARAVAVLGRRFDRPDELFARMNGALATDGALLLVAQGVAVPAPVHLVFVGASADGDIAMHLRHLVELRKDASLTLVEHHLGQGEHRHLANHLLHVHLAGGARLVHARLQDESIGATLFARTDAVLASNSEYRRVDLELGAGLSRHELNISLQGEGAAAIAGGMLLADGRRHLDTRLGVQHQARNTRCELPWRGLADQRGRAVFHGGITIHAGADGSDAALSNKNLLLSDSAEIDSQPVLVIHADEVKAAHGATVGRLDETALFYLRSRGIGLAQARSLLIQAFLREPLSVLGDATLADALGALVTQRLDRKELGA
ncbi:MAG: Fe-S cluster assembly protein SufD [Arenimonas sp.]|uniref:Fe-S cluster assembly protein SufD n=1 Tax=Arenimonas sp. TaxID=1872635 RepID=UPI0025BE5246|nr:Fe-S cluster assembly protein SufD [Arenimonas sp.]MBW8369328.1 Fe-S cluster assembly protein SufD [Arenimonas sp.]